MKAQTCVGCEWEANCQYDCPCDYYTPVGGSMEYEYLADMEERIDDYFEMIAEYSDGNY